MKKLFNVIYKAHSALRERNPGMPTLRQHVRMIFCAALMFTAFTIAYRNPETQLQIGGLVAGLLAFGTIFGIAFDNVKPEDFHDSGNSL